MLDVRYISIKSIPQEDLNNILKLHFNDDISRHCKFLGGGSDGSVYVFEGKNKKYALKSYNPLSKNRQDAQILYQLQGCPCIPTLYGFVPNELVITDFIDGQDLEDKVERMPTPVWKHQVKWAFDFFKFQGILPRDLRDANIMMDKEGNLWFIDVGLFQKREDTFLFNNELESVHFIVKNKTLLKYS